MPTGDAGTARAHRRVARWFEVARSGSPSVAFDGREVLYVGDAAGLPQAWRIPIHGGEARPLFQSRERVGWVDTCPTRPRAVVGQDAGGNEAWQLELFALEEGGARTRERRRPITADPKVMNLQGRWTSDGHAYLFSSNARDHRFFDVYRADVDGWSPPERIWTGDAWHEAAATDGRRTVVRRFNTFLDSDLFLIETGRPTVHLNPHRSEMTVSSVSLGPGGVYVAGNPDREFLGVLRYPFDGSEPELVGEYDADVEVVRVSPDGQQLAVVVNRDGWSELRVRDLATPSERTVSVRPRGVVYSLAWQPDSAGFAFDLSWLGGHEIFVHDLKDQRTRRLTRSPSGTPGPTPEPRLRSVTSSDGLRIPYWEYAGRSARPRGTIFSIHGGPEGQARPEFDPELGFLVAEGWRVIVPNVRGSTGYGRTYLHLDDVRRRMDSVRDVREIAESLLRSQPSARGRLGIMGGSYGGFMVLSAIATYPELWGAAVELFGISNFVSFLERTADWRRSLREAEYGSLANDREFLAAISPIHHLDRIRTPLFVFHGRNDPRVPIHEAEQIVEALRAAGRAVESQYFENEGHGFVRRENQIETVRRAGEFFQRYLAAAPARSRRRRAGRSTRGAVSVPRRTPRGRGRGSRATRRSPAA